MRGNVYAQYAKDFPDRMKVIGIAEPKDVRRKTFQNRFSIDDNHTFSCWTEVYVLMPCKIRNNEKEKSL